MSGNSVSKYLLDTNAVIYFLNGEEKVAALIAEPMNVINVSFITKIELLCFETEDIDVLYAISEFLKEISVVYINDDIITAAINYRKGIKLKIPDAIIAATAKVMGLSLVTADKELTNKLTDIKTVSPI